MRILSDLHGIGLIVLDILDLDNPPIGRIAIPAKERPDVDWNATNRLAKENRGFKEYVKNIRQFYQTDELKKADWEWDEFSLVST